MNGEFLSGGLRLARHTARPVGKTGRTTAVIMCHGFPIGPLDARQSASTFPELMDRVAAELGWTAMTFTFRGCGTSEGDFSLQGWIEDLKRAIDVVVEEDDPLGVWLVGTNTGGSLALLVGADDPRVRGAALLGARSGFEEWADQPRRFLEHARELGAVRTLKFPSNLEEWGREFQTYRPLEAARRFAPKDLLVMHGDDDESVPTSDARQIAQAHGSAELRIIAGAGHRLRHDPRAVAILMGWLDRQRNRFEA
jgi:putative redox protein